MKTPKYKNADLSSLKTRYASLMEMRPHLKDNYIYKKLVNALSQIIIRLERACNSTWNNISERGLNKSIPPVVKKGSREIVFPYEWQDEKTGQMCFVNGYWDAVNYMVMDAVAYFFLLTEGGDVLPKDFAPMFDNLTSIENRESELQQSEQDKQPVCQSLPADSGTPQIIKNAKHWITFTDKDFRKFTGSTSTSNEILKRLLDTSRVEFKMVFPVRLHDEKNKFREKLYSMNMFSRLFEIAYTDKDVRSDSVVQNRKYYIVFNTLLGELFVHNLKAKNYDFIDNRFYTLPSSAQIFYRRFLMHNNYRQIQVNLDTIKDTLNLTDHNITNLINTIEGSVLEPLKKYGFIVSYSKQAGLNGIKYV